MLKTILFAVQFIAAIALILSVLLHPAKTMGMGGLGSPSEIFGSQKGAEDGLNKITAVLAAIWGLTAILLSVPSIINQ
ncbi:preprotein translocase subunit SecG [bacterium]|nr:MAG: preprotein translocase subunit SecG [bacterium]